MKKLFSLMVVLLAAGAHWGCNSNNSTPTTPGTSAPTYTYPFLFSWGNNGSGNGQFNGTSGIAFHNNTIFVVDRNNNRVEKFDTNGNYLGQWSGTLSGPNGIAVDKLANVYVADSGNNQIQKYDFNGNLITAFGTSGSGNGQFSGPSGIAVDTNLNMYVADLGNNRVQKLNSAGTYVTKLGGLASGTGNGQFDTPWNLALDSNANVYVADTNNNRVQVLSSNLAYQSQFGAFGTGNGQFDAPIGIVVDKDGNVIVANDSASTTEPAVQKFSPSGTFLKLIAPKGIGAGKIKGDAFYVTVDPSNNLYVADYGGSMVDKFAPY